MTPDQERSPSYRFFNSKLVRLADALASEPCESPRRPRLEEASRAYRRLRQEHNPSGNGNTPTIGG